MTANQISKRLTKNNFSLENVTINKDMIQVAVGYFERDGLGFVNSTKTKTLANKIKKQFPECSYTSQTRYGAIIIWFNFRGNSFASQNID